MHELLQNQYLSKLAVVCPADSRKGRGKKLQPCPIKAEALRLGLDVHTLPPQKSFKLPADEVSDIPGAWDLGVVVSFGYFLSRSTIDSFAHGMVNVHPSLLPKYRGAAPVQHALLNGDTDTGVSVQKLSPTIVDAGDLLAQQAMPIPPSANYEVLLPSLAQLGADLLKDVVADFPAAEAGSRAQTPDTGPLASKLDRKLGHINWTEMDAVTVWRRWRGLTGCMPVSCTFQGKNLRLNGLCGYVLEQPGNEDVAPGSLRYDINLGLLLVQCGGRNRGQVAVTQVSRAGKACQDARMFANGFMGKASKVKGDLPSGEIIEPSGVFLSKEGVVFD